MLRAAHDDEGGVNANPVARHRRVKHGEIVARQLSKTFLPVSENSRLELDFRAHGGNQGAVGSGARDAQEIARLAAGFFRGGQAEGNAAVRRSDDAFCGARQIPRELKLLCKDIRGPGRQNGERHLAAGQAIHHFVYRAVASAHDHELPRRVDRAARHDGRIAGRRRVLKLRFDSGVAEYAARFVQFSHGTAAASRGIDDQHCVANLRRHLVHSVSLKNIHTKRTKIP